MLRAEIETPDLPRAARRAETLRCYHCELPVPADGGLYADIDGSRRPVCCAGCKAVAEAIAGGGLGDYYRLRDKPARTAEPRSGATAQATALYDRPRVQEGLVQEGEAGLRRVSLILEGIECAACAWVIERQLTGLKGVRDLQLNYATRRAEVEFDPLTVRLSEILDAVSRIGYGAHPYRRGEQEAALEAERRRRLKGLGVAGVLGMQVMMVAAVLYAGDWYGMAPRFRHLFEWLGILLTAPVLGYSARPFYRGAWRALRHLQPNMDVPVSLGISIAFAGSLWSALSGEGAVYFDSIVMFVFLLLLARYLEFMARRRTAGVVQGLDHGAPVIATRIDRERSTTEAVPAAELERGDQVLVRAREVVPADGRIISGESSLDEALLTGESRPLRKRPGDRVLAGSLNQQSPLEVEVDAVGDATVLARILALAERATLTRPRVARVTDRIAGVFVTVVVLLAVIVGLYWASVAPHRWLPITVAMLVATCPCALSLATPAALTAAIQALARRGLLVVRGDALETLSRVNHLVFDKTGTLTRGRPRLASIDTPGRLSDRDCLAIAAALERHSEHPLARAILSAAAKSPIKLADDVLNTPGAGLQGSVDGSRYVLGSPAFVAEQSGLSMACNADDPASLVVLADRSGVLALLHVSDPLRDEATAVLGAIIERGYRVSLYSGDREAAVAATAGRLGIDDWAAELRPEDKLARIRELQRGGEMVAMIGDGVNDAPVLAGADLAIAMGAAATGRSADLVLATSDLRALPVGIEMALRARRIIIQNLAWALAYNLLVLPAAALGWVAPWMAAIGMSLSSIVVIVNATRLERAP